MRQLEDEIALTERQLEKLLVHLRELAPESAEAVAVHASLDTRRATD